ncbi:hypothetical protein Bca101_055274 [Brassica carinata]
MQNGGTATIKSAMFFMTQEDDKAEAPEDEMVVKEHVVEKNQNWNRSLKNRRRRRDFETSIKPYSKKALVRNRNMKR